MSKEENHSKKYYHNIITKDILDQNTNKITKTSIINEFFAKLKEDLIQQNNEEVSLARKNRDEDDSINSSNYDININLKLKEEEFEKEIFHGHDRKHEEENIFSELIHKIKHFRDNCNFKNLHFNLVFEIFMEHSLLGQINKSQVISSLKKVFELLNNTHILIEDQKVIVIIN